jgi:hypothetical protein
VFFVSGKDKSFITAIKNIVIYYKCVCAIFVCMNVCVILLVRHILGFSCFDFKDNTINYR